MRSWILGAGLAAVAAGGVYFVATGGSPTHCGPCVSGPAAAPADPPEPPPVVEVVDVAAALAKPAAPLEERFVSFDEPPLAKPLADRAPAPNVIQAAFEEPAPRAEVAPMPRPAHTRLAPGRIGLGNFWAYTLPDVEVAPPPRPAGPTPLAEPGDSF